MPKDNFFLILLALILMAAGLNEASKWVLRKKDSSHAVTSATNSPLEKKSSAPANANSNKDSISKPILENKEADVWVLIAFDKSQLSEKNVDELSFYILLEKTLSTRVIQDSSSPRRTYRFTTQPDLIPPRITSQFKLTGMIKKLAKNEWSLSFQFAKKDRSSLQIVITREQHFPLPNPLPKYKIVYNDAAIAEQMSSVLTEAITQHHEVSQPIMPVVEAGP